MKYDLTKKKLWAYILIILLAFFVVINKEVDIKYYDINYLSNINVLYIFLFNFIIVTIWFVFAHLGISIFFCF